MSAIITPTINKRAYDKLMLNRAWKRGGINREEALTPQDFDDADSWKAFSGGGGSGALSTTSSGGVYGADNTTGFNLNPSPRSGRGAHGAVPGPLGLPDPYGDLKKVLPDIDALNSRTSASILDQLGGNLSAETISALNNHAAERGVSSGMPGAQTWDHLFLGNIAGGMENLKQQGIQNYNTFVPNVSRTQTVDPALQASIANTNAINAAAPDPTEAARESERLFNQYKQSIGVGGGGGNPGGGTRGGGGAPTFPSINSFIQPRNNSPTTPASTTPGTFNAPPPTFQPNPTIPPAGSVPDWFDAANPGGWDNFVNPGGGTVGGFGPTVGAPYGDDFWDEYNQWQY